MPSTFLGLTIGTSGLYTYQAALNVTANNIANVETAGYTRQEALQKASEALRCYNSYGMIGTGTNCTGIVQIRNSYYDTKYWQTNTKYGEYGVKSYYMDQLDGVFYETEDSTSGFTSVFNKLFDAVDVLSNDGTNGPNRTLFANVAQQFAEYFNSSAESLLKMQSDCNDEIATYVDRINSIAQEIYALNGQINVVELAGGTANVLRDERALLIDELSEIVPVEVEEHQILSQDGVPTKATSYNVFICGQQLVEHDSYEQLKYNAREKRVNTSDADGLYDIVWDNGNKFNITSSKLSGKLNALFQMRDGNNENPFSGKVDSVNGTTITITSSTYDKMNQISLNDSGTIKLGNKEFAYEGYTATENPDGTISFELNITDSNNATLSNYIGKNAQAGTSIKYCGIPYYMSQLDEFVRGFAEAVNDILITGKDEYDNAGSILFTGANAVGHEYDFVGAGDSYNLITAANFKVSSKILDDVKLIATTDSYIENTDAGNIMDKIYNLMNDKDELSFRGAAVSEFITCIVSDIAVDGEKVNTFHENYYKVCQTIINQRLSVSGADSDEEASNLIIFQNAYNLSAKSIQVMTEVYDKLILDTGV